MQRVTSTIATPIIDRITMGATLSADNPTIATSTAITIGA
ncbi:hypothetical protein GALL_525900 [mine drainage metagenome]|uniref:Uncharacterized protein n=1 Tax=mine drainage metagenome TaxID=410659 RepID=A0A1J5PDE5_9ZZZZ